MLQESTVKDTLHLNKNSHIGYQTLARKFCAVNREFSDLLYLMNTRCRITTVTIKTLGQNSHGKFTNFLKVVKLLGTN